MQLEDLDVNDQSNHQAPQSQREGQCCTHQAQLPHFHKDIQENAVEDDAALLFKGKNEKKRGKWGRYNGDNDSRQNHLLHLQVALHCLKHR